MRKLARLLPFSFCVIASCLLPVLSGCGAGPVIPAGDSPVNGTLALQGVVHGGQQGVSGATVQLYTVGATGNGSAATAMLTPAVTSDANGFFHLNNGSTYLYHCTHATDQVYITATQGSTGAGNNTALAMMTALGNCGNLSSNTYIVINEVTTAAAAWALAPFITSYAAIGASATNSAGIANAMLDAQLLASSSTGLAATNASNITIEPGKLYALADAIAPCINSAGGTACSPLFTAAGIVASDTLTAALNIVRHPARNISAVYNLIGSTPPFPTNMTQPPNDWTITMSVTGGGVTAPTSIDIDSNSNVWVGDYAGLVSEFNAQGTPLSGTGFGSGALNEVYGLTIDSNNNIWASNEQSSPHSAGSVTKLYGSNSSTPGAVVTGTGGGTNFYDNSINFPVALSADTNGDIFISNYANQSVTAYNSSGTAIATNLGSPDLAFPVAIAADSTHGVWIANLDSSTVTHSAANGTILSNGTCCNGANGIAVDALGNAWIANYYGSSFSEVSAAGTTLISNAALITDPANHAYPAGVTVDAGQNVWVANYRGESISEISGALSTTPGTLLSPADGFGYNAAIAPNNPLLLLPYGVVADRSGNLWVSNNGNNNLVMFFGIATPTATPIQPVPTAP